jgi:hypothetical protein
MPVVTKPSGHMSLSTTASWASANSTSTATLKILKEQQQNIEYQIKDAALIESIQLAI